MDYVKVPYEDYVKGISARTMLEAIRRLVSAEPYCISDIRILLDIKAEDDADA